MEINELRDKMIQAKLDAEAATKEFKDAVLTAAENGDLFETRTSEWIDYYSSKETSKRYYCKECNAISPHPNNIAFLYCPNCGAKMRNAKYIPKFFGQQEIVPDESSGLIELTDTERVRPIIEKMISKGLTRREVCELSGISDTTFHRIMHEKKGLRLRVISAFEKLEKEVL